MRLLPWTVTLLVFCGSAAEGLAAADAGVPASAAGVVSGPVEIPPPSEKALSYYHTGNALWLFNTAWGILVPAVLLFTGLSAWIWSWAQRAGRKWFFSVGLYFLMFWILMYFIDWPLNFGS